MSDVKLDDIAVTLDGQQVTLDAGEPTPSDGTATRMRVTERVPLMRVVERRRAMIVREKH